MKIAQTHNLRDLSQHLLEGVGAVLKEGQRLGDIGQKLLAVDGQCNLAVFLVEQLDIQLLFQLADGVAQAGLGDVQLLRGAGIVERLSQDKKVAQLKKGHDSSPFYCSLSIFDENGNVKADFRM